MHTLRFTILLVLMSCGAGPGKTKGASGETLPTSSGHATKESAPEWTLSPDQEALRFQNGEGARVYLAPVRSAADASITNRYLLQITGSHSPHDGLVLLVERRVIRGDAIYVAQLSGKPWWALRYETDKRAWEGFGYDEEHELGPVQVIDQSYDARELLRLRAVQSGTKLREIETLTFGAARKAQDEEYSEYLAETTEACGPVESAIDWSTVQRGWPEQVSIARACRPALNILEAYCRRHPRALSKLRNPIALSCKFESKLKDVERPGLAKVSAANFVYTPDRLADDVERLLHFYRTELGGKEEVLRHGKTHLIVRHRLEGSRIYHSTTNSFYRIVSQADGWGSGYSWRDKWQHGGLKLKDGKWTLRCGDRKQALEELVDGEAQAVLKDARFEPGSLWKREDYFLARDSRGTYYYVDRYQRSFGGGHYRVFVGRKGQLKLSKLKRLVEDSEGTLFSTTRGDLRLIVTRDSTSGVWIRGRKRRELTTVGLGRNQKLIYDELGVYYGEKLGLICE